MHQEEDVLTKALFPQPAETFFKKNFKPNTLNLTEGEDTKQEQQAEAVKQSVATTDDEEVVAVDDELVENMLGLTPSK